MKELFGPRWAALTNNRLYAPGRRVTYLQGGAFETLGRTQERDGEPQSQAPDRVTSDVCGFQKGWFGGGIRRVLAQGREKGKGSPSGEAEKGQTCCAPNVEKIWSEKRGGDQRKVLVGGRGPDVEPRVTAQGKGQLRSETAAVRRVNEHLN